MKSKRLLIPAVFVALLAGAASTFAQQYYSRPPFQYDRADAEEAMEQRGYYDGIQGAERDFTNHRRPNVNNRDEYRDPDSVPRWAQQEYREGFRRGYNVRVQQIYGRQRYGDGDRDRYWYEPR
ncbi:MAG: hypothetical protein NVSMB62_19320 [Acidobacteriaceae bacterium]